MSRPCLKQYLFVLPLLLAFLCLSCLRAQETSFFSKFSTRELVERNKAAAGLDCDAKGGGGGAADSSWAIGKGRSQSHKSDSFGAGSARNRILTRRV
jgi:hypothetical protein